MSSWARQGASVGYGQNVPTLGQYGAAGEGGNCAPLVIEWGELVITD